MFIRHLVKSTSSLGVENSILSLERNPNPAFRCDGVDIYQAKENFNIASTGFSIQSISILRELADSVDVVHYHFPWPFMDLAHFAARIKKPSIVTYHSDIVRQKMLLKLYNPLMHAFLDDVNAIVATSPNYLKSSPVLQHYADKTSMISIGLDESLYPSPDSSSVEKWKKRFGGRFFLFVGVLRYYKGLHVLLEAISKTDIPLLIVGAGPIENELVRQSHQLGLVNVHFIGEVSEQDKVDLMTACYGIVFPSHLRSEAFGISLLEGAMFGKPLICSEIGTGTSYINVHEMTGLVVPPSDVDSLRQAMVYLWNNTEQAKAFGVEARKRYERLFSADTMGNNYLDLYEKLISSSS